VLSRTAIIIYGLLCFCACGLTIWSLQFLAGVTLALCVFSTWAYIFGGIFLLLWGLYGEFDEAITAGIVIEHGHEPGYQLPAECLRAPYANRRMGMRDEWLPATEVPERWSLTILDEEGRTATLYFDSNVLGLYPVASYYPHQESSS
jgi:hypothetical protein